MADPVSWYLVEPGWEVVDSTGEALGEVLRVTGDAEADIFDGLEVRPPGARELFVPAEHVVRIEEGRIEVGASRAELDASSAQAPGGAEIRPEP